LKVEGQEESLKALMAFITYSKVTLFPRSLELFYSSPLYLFIQACTHSGSRFDASTKYYR